MSVIFLFFTAAAAAAQPSIHFGHTDYDFSAIAEEDQVRHVFDFSNTGDQELVITKAVAS